MQGRAGLAALRRARSEDTRQGLANNLAVPAHLRVKGTCPNETVHSRMRDVAAHAPSAHYETKAIGWRRCVYEHNSTTSDHNAAADACRTPCVRHFDAPSLEPGKRRVPFCALQPWCRFDNAWCMH